MSGQVVSVLHLIDLPLPLIRGVLLSHEPVDLAVIEVGIVIGKGGRMPRRLLRLVGRDVGRWQGPRVRRHGHLDAAVARR